MKKRWIVLLILIALVFIAIISYLFSWRLFGFRLCDHPGSIRIESVEANDGVLVVSGKTKSSALRFAGYKIKRKGSTVYIGIKTRLFFTKSKLGSFKIEIPIDDSMEKAILTNGSNEELIYTKLE